MAVQPIIKQPVPATPATVDPLYRRATKERKDHLDPISEAGIYVSEERYWQEYYFNDDFHYEWNNGILEEKPVADYRNVLLYQWFFMLVEAYLMTHPIAKLINLEVGFRLVLPTKTTIRKPDFFIIRNDNPVPLADKDYTYAGIADLCVESLSDSKLAEVRRDTVTKKGEYAGAGVQEYYILDAYERHTTFYSRQPTGHYGEIQPDAAGIIRSQVLPGFQFRVSDLRQRPPLLALTDDPVYQGYVLPEYQAIKIRAEQERQRAEQERQRAEQERQRAEQERQRAEQERQRAEQQQARAEQEHARAERLAAQLRALGRDEV